MEAKQLVTEVKLPDDGAKKAIVGELEAVTAELLEVLSTFDQAALNTIPFAGSWTAAQVAEHILKSDQGVLKTLHGRVKPTERPPDAGLEGLKATFLNFTTKLKSPEFILPSPAAQNKETLLQSLQSTRSSISRAADTLDLTQTCLDMPVLGEITRLELIHFVIYHTQRHIHQLRNISKVLLENYS